MPTRRCPISPPCTRAARRRTCSTNKATRRSATRTFPSTSCSVTSMSFPLAAPLAFRLTTTAFASTTFQDRPHSVQRGKAEKGTSFPLQPRPLQRVTQVFPCSILWTLRPIPFLPRLTIRTPPKTLHPEERTLLAQRLELTAPYEWEP